MSLKVVMYPLIFMLRRSIFIGYSIWLGEHPALQMICHHVTTIVYIAVLSSDGIYASTHFKVIDVGSELLGLFIAAMLQQCQIFSDNASQFNITVGFLASLSLLLLLNIYHMVATLVANYREKKRLRRMLKLGQH